MLARDTTGEGVEAPRLESWRGNGRRITDRQARRIRDIFCRWLRHRVGLSPADIEYVLSLGISSDRITRRLKEPLPEHFARMIDRV